MYDLPGLGAYYAAADRNTASSTQELKQMLSMAQITGAMQKVRRQTRLGEMAELAAGDTGDPMQTGPTVDAGARMDATGVNPLTAPAPAPAPRQRYTAEQVTQGRSAAIQSRIDYLNHAADQLEAAGVIDASEKYRNKALEYSKLLPTYHATERETVLPDGRRGLVKINSFGEEAPASFTPAAKQGEPDGLLTNLGIDRSNPLYRQTMLARARKLATHQPASSNTVINAGPRAFETALGKLDAEKIGEWRKNAEAGQTMLGTVTNLRNAVRRGVYSGGTANLQVEAANLINGLTGFTPRGLPGSQLFDAEASKLVLDSIKQLGANPSNADRDFIAKTIPQLATSPQARDALIAFLESKAMRNIDLYQRADEYARQNHGLGGFPAFTAPAAPSGGANIEDLVRKYSGGR
ncbi:MAG: hypothetical protein GEV05_27175 [Betaproteobacteria bacterium]|nr:hypothetical protein [Betaproteobacteria bacterium]